MSSNNIFLSVSVFLNLVLLALFWATLSSTSKDTADLAKFKQDLDKQKTDFTQMLNERRLIKEKIGLQADVVGTEDDQSSDTLLGKMNQVIALGGGVTEGERTMEGAIRKLKGQDDNLTVSVRQKQNEYNTKSIEYNNLIAQKTAEVKQYLDARQKAEDQLQKLVKEHGEEIDRKDQLISQLRQERDELNAQLARVIAEKDAIIAQRDERIAQQSRSLTRLRREKFEREDLSFEIPDGKVVYVDRDRGLLTINLGREDGLRVGTTFSVYEKDNSGIGRRDLEDIKAKIEVTRIQGPHRAEARILDPRDAVKERPEDDIDSYFARSSRYYQSSLLRPISVGDPVYSPAFSKGAVERFSFVGLVDLDGDGKSDRETLHNLVRAAGGKIDNEVDDEGNFTAREGISYETKFLVIGDLGDPTETEDAKRQAVIQRIQEKAKTLREEALDNGVRIVTLRAFLSYLGYQPTASPWVKGEDYQTQLKAGAASSGVSEVLGGRVSQGNVSGVHDAYQRRLFNLNDSIGRRGTSGNVSGLYKGK